MILSCLYPYRYGFNGKEKDNETYGDGNSLDFGARIYDSRIGRWLSLDIRDGNYPGISPYSISYNNPIIFKDPDGKDGRLTIVPDGKGGGTITLETTVHLYSSQMSDGQLAELVNQTNAKFNELKNSYTYIDAHGGEWKVEFKATFVSNQEFKKSEKDVYDISREEAKKVGGDNFKAGDNVICVDCELPTRLEDEGRVEVVESGFSAAHVAVPNFIIHVLAHFMGAVDKYKGSAEDIAYWSGDWGTFINITHIDEFYFINLAKTVLNEVSNPTTVIPVQNKVLEGRKNDLLNPTQTAEEYKAEQTTRKNNPQTPNPPPEQNEEENEEE